MAMDDIRRARGPRKDLAGRKIGRWTVLSYAGDSRWNCRCECGAEKTISTRHLSSARTRSCGCLKADLSSDRNSARLDGARFGRLMVLRRAGSNKRFNALWLCRCDCGEQAVVTSHRLISGKTLSCGCLQKERTTTHGLSRTRTYRIWIKMRDRCENPRSDNYPDYGGRGITVCERWREFPNFLADMGHAPDGQSLDRIDNDRGYEPTNCRWATKTVQLNNTRRNRLVTIDGHEMPLTAAIALLRRMAKPKYKR